MFDGIYLKTLEVFIKKSEQKAKINSPNLRKTETLSTNFVNGKFYLVKYTIEENSEYQLTEVESTSLDKLLEHAHFLIAKKISKTPEMVHLHSVYDLEGELLWGNSLPYEISNSKNDKSGMSRREFLTAFGVANALFLLGFPKASRAATTAVNLLGSASGFAYVDDVFKTSLYVGNGGTQTITNGIDLAEKGGMIWVKSRTSGSLGHFLSDTTRGIGSYVDTTTAGAQTNGGGNSISSVSSNGFSIGSYSGWNAGSANYVAWTFRKATNFLDVVTYTGNGISREISHNLGSVPGVIIIKRTDSTGAWTFRHRGSYPQLHRINESTASVGTDSGYVFGNDSANIEPTATKFTISSNVNWANAVGGTYVAYLFAHDTSATGIIQCGSATSDSGGKIVGDLGWEPQFILYKGVQNTSNWEIVDTTRGWTASTPDKGLMANLSSSETDVSYAIHHPTSTGFEIQTGFQNQNYIYIAIRRPNKPPTTGREVFNPSIIGSTGITDDGWPVDMTIGRARVSTQDIFLSTRLTNRTLKTNLSNAETNSTEYLKFDSDRGVNNAGFYSPNGLFLNFRRAPGFFDVVCYTGTGTGGPQIKHSLGVQPQIIIAKARSTAGNWIIDVKDPDYTDGWLTGTAGSVFALNSPNASTALVSRNINHTSVFFTPAYIGNGYYDLNASGVSYLALLFSSLPGISQVGRYLGNGSSQTIHCGFTTGARFILIKRTDSAGDWYVWDSARGISVGNDPHLSLNSNAAEVTGDDSVGTSNSGFIVNQVTATNINVLNSKYIFLAIS